MHLLRGIAEIRHLDFTCNSQEFIKYFVSSVHMCASFVMYVIFLSVMYELTKVTKGLS